MLEINKIKTLLILKNIRNKKMFYFTSINIKINLIKKNIFYCFTDATGF